MGVYRKIQIACPHCGKNATKFCKHDGSLLNCPSCKTSIKLPPQKKRKGDFYIDYKVSGKRVWEYPGSSYNLAKKILAKRQAEIAEDRFLDKKGSTKILFKEAVAEYLKQSKANKRPNSSRRDVGSSKNLLRFFGEAYLQDMIRNKVEDYKKTRREDEKAAGATVNREPALLKHLFNKNNWINLKAEDTKNSEPRNVPMDENLVVMLSRLPHLRHTAATNLRRKSVKVETAMAVVGHKSIAMFKRYRKLGEDDMDEARTAMREMSKKPECYI